MLRVVLLNSKIFNSFSHAFICLDKEGVNFHIYSKFLFSLCGKGELFLIEV